MALAAKLPTEPFGTFVFFTVIALAGPIGGPTFGSAIFPGGSWSDLWLYIVGPSIGGAVGAAIHWFQIKGSEVALEPPEGYPSPGAPAPVSEGSESRP